MPNGLILPNRASCVVSGHARCAYAALTALIEPWCAVLGHAVPHSTGQSGPDMLFRVGRLLLIGSSRPDA